MYQVGDYYVYRRSYLQCPPPEYKYEASTVVAFLIVFVKW